MKLIRLEVLSYFWEKVKVYITTELPTIYKYKGSKKTYAELIAITNMVLGDVWNVEQADKEHDVNAGDNFAWNGTSWDNLRGYIDLSDYYKKGEIDEQRKVIDQELDDLDKLLKEKFAKAEEDITAAREYSDKIVRELHDEIDEDMRQNIEDVNQRIQDTKDDLNNKKAELDKIIADHHAELEATKADLEKTKAHLEDVKGQLEGEIETANGEIDDTKDKLEAAKGRLTDAESEIDAAKKRLSEAETSIGDAKLLIDKNAGAIAANTEYIDKEHNRINEANLLISANTASIDLNAKSINAANESIKSAGIRIDGINAIVEQHATHLNTIDGSITDVGTKIDAINGTIKSHGEHLDTVDGTLNTVNQTLDALDAKITNEAKRVDTVSGEITSAKTEWNGKYATITSQVQTIDTKTGDNTKAISTMDGKLGKITDRVEKLDGETGAVVELQRQIDATNQTITDEINSLTGTEPEGTVTALKRQMDGINKTITDTISETLDDPNSTVTSKVQSKLDLLHETITNEVTKSITDKTSGYVTETWLGQQINGEKGIIRTAIDTSITDNNKKYTTTESLSQMFDNNNKTITTAYQTYVTDNTTNLSTVQNWVGQQIDGANGIIKTAYENYVNDKTKDMATTSYVGQQIDGVNGKITTAVTEAIEEKGVVTKTNLSQELDKQKGTIKTIASELITDPDTGEVYNFSEIKQNKNNITLAVASANSAQASADDINKFLGDRKEGDTLDSKLAAISITDDQIAAVVANKVTSASIIAKINENNDSSISINADQILLTGETIADKLTALKADISDLQLINAKVTGEINAMSGHFANLFVNGERIVAGTYDDTIHEWVSPPQYNDSNTYFDGDGILHCNGAVIEGDITASTGHFGNLYIDGNKVYAGQGGSGSCGSDGSSSYFDADGILHCKGAQIQGDVVANTFATNMAKFKVSNEGILTATDAKLSGTLAAAQITTTSGNFVVNESGVLTAKNAKISGEITASKLTINDDSFMNRLIVRKVSTADEGKRVTVADNTMTMYDSTNTIRMKVSGEALAESKDSETINIDLASFLNRNLTTAETQQRGFNISDIEVLTKTFTCSSGAMLQLPVFKGTVGIDFNGDIEGNFDITLRYFIDNVEVGYTAAFEEFNKSSHINNNVSYGSAAGGADVSLTAGSHTLKIKADVILGYNENESTSNISVGCSLNSTTMKVYYPAELVEVGSNGFRTMFGSNYKAEFVKDSSTNDVSFVIRAGNYILKISDSGIQKSTNGGSSWTSL